jgi:hypothetical protein
MVGKPYEGYRTGSGEVDESSRKSQQYLAAGIAAGIVVFWALLVWFGLSLFNSVT